MLIARLLCTMAALRSEGGGRGATTPRWPYIWSSATGYYSRGIISPNGWRGPCSWRLWKSPSMRGSVPSTTYRRHSTARRRDSLAGREDRTILCGCTDRRREQENHEALLVVRRRAPRAGQSRLASAWNAGRDDPDPRPYPDEERNGDSGPTQPHPTVRLKHLI